MERHRVRPWPFEKIMQENPAYIDWVLHQVRARGPLLPDDVREPDGTVRRIPGAWNDSVPRAALEAHFGRGLLAIADRRPNFARAYDMAERIVPPQHHARQVDRADAQRELLRLAGRALGIATAADLADYYRMPISEARPPLAELVEAGDLREVRVEGWSAPAYLHREARAPRLIDAASLLSPFDPVVWYRPRAERLFQFEYRIEIYVPQPSASGATTCCRSYWASGWWRASTSRRIAPRVGCACWPLTWSPTRIPARWRKRSPPNWPCGRNGWTSKPSRSKSAAHSPACWRPRCGRPARDVRSFSLPRRRVACPIAAPSGSLHLSMLGYC
jgi:hypothetical protein